MYISLKLINKTVRFTGGERFDTYRALVLINKVVSYAGVVYYSLSDQIYRHTDVQTYRHTDIQVQSCKVHSNLLKLIKWSDISAQTCLMHTIYS